MEGKVNIKKDLTIKEKLSILLFDKKNPEMITFLYDQEIDRIAALETVINDENEIRKVLNIQSNIYTNYIKSVKVHRTSKQGWRANQGENIIKSNVEDETALKTGLGSKLKNIMK